MTSISYSPVTIQASSQSVPAPPVGLGDAVLIVHNLRKLSVLDALAGQERFARRRDVCYGVFDFGAVLLGNAKRRETFYKHVQPFAAAFMALFGRDRMPHHSTLFRYLSALYQGTDEALRTPASREICWPAHWAKSSSWVDSGIERASNGSSSTSMARAKGPACAPCPGQRIDKRPDAG